MLLSNGSLVPTQVDTIADRTPMLADANYYTSNLLQLAGTWAEFSEIYRRQLWVGTVVRKLAFATARMPFEIKLHRGDGVEVENGKLMALLKRPNDKMSGFRLWQWVSSIRDIYGEAFLIKIRDKRGEVRELHPMHPSNVTIRRDDETGKLWYLWHAGTRSGEFVPGFPEEDVIAFTGFNPDNITRGLSNLESLRMTLLNEDASRRATASFWNKGARPGAFLSHPKTLTDPAAERLQKSFDKANSGPDNVGRTMLLEEGLTVTVSQLTLEEMQYIESRKLNREEVCAAYDVSPLVVHILDHATFSNITEQLRSQYRDTMAPRFVDFESVIDHQLVPDFYPSDDAFSHFNMDDVLRGDFEQRATSAATVVNAGIFKPSEARPMFGLPDAGPVANQLFANAALVPLGSNARAAQPVATDGTLIPQPLEQAPAAAASAKAIASSATRQLKSRLGRVKDNKQATRAVLVDEHAKALRAFFGEQRFAVKAALASKARGIFNPADWDAKLKAVLAPLSTATTNAIGTKTAADLGGTYDGARIAAWLDTDAEESAQNINRITADKVASTLQSADEDPELDPEEEIDGLFDDQEGGRADEISLSRVVMLAGFASLVAAEQSNASTKTWIVTAANPRASHASMDGETVALSEPFSNGMNGPGDFSGGADEVAGCSCELQFNMEGN